MDATQWNAYQIVANRARAVCYTTRQQIFRMKTEAAVNKLVQTSQEQISGMEKLHEDQQKLGKVREKHTNLWVHRARPRKSSKKL